jgi:hypothetical protein
VILETPSSCWGSVISNLLTVSKRQLSTAKESVGLTIDASQLFSNALREVIARPILASSKLKKDFERILDFIFM